MYFNKVQRFKIGELLKPNHIYSLAWTWQRVTDAAQIIATSFLPVLPVCWLAFSSLQGVHVYYCYTAFLTLHLYHGKIIIFNAMEQHLHSETIVSCYIFIEYIFINILYLYSSNLLSSFLILQLLLQKNFN